MSQLNISCVTRCLALCKNMPCQVSGRGVSLYFAPWSFPLAKERRPQVQRGWRASAKPFENAKDWHASCDKSHATPSEKPICTGKVMCNSGPNEYGSWATLSDLLSKRFKACFSATILPSEALPLLATRCNASQMLGHALISSMGPSVISGSSPCIAAAAHPARLRNLATSDAWKATAHGLLPKVELKGTPGALKQV